VSISSISAAAKLSLLCTDSSSSQLLHSHVKHIVYSIVVVLTIARLILAMLATAAAAAAAGSAKAAASTAFEQTYTQLLLHVVQLRVTCIQLLLLPQKQYD
jgi:hypothetical protein